MTGVATAGETFSIFGTTATLLVSDPAAVSVARTVADAELAAVDQACSRFRPDSELARLNAAEGRAVPVSKLFAEILDVALRAAKLTGGDVDPTCGRALADIGYDRDFAVLLAAGDTGPLPRQGRSRPERQVPGWRSVQLDRERGQVRLRRGALLDLGSTAKAWAADRCAARIAAATGSGVLVSLGGDIAVAGPAPDAGWRIRVTDDHAASQEAPGQTVTIAAGGLATSSTTVRTWAMGGQRMHHIIDPATGEPAAVVLADRERRGRQLRRRQHREHRGDHPERSGAALAAGRRPAGPAGADRRVGRAGRGLAARAAASRRGMTGPGAAGSLGGIHPSAIVVNSTTPLWYLTRATGLVALVLLTASMALGMLSSVRYQRPAWPRFVVTGLHRNSSLLALVFTAVHIATTLADGFVPIKLQDVVIPFISAYRPVWLGLGTVALDLMIALTITSLLRTRMSYRSWRLVHWMSYLCWPVAVLHGLGTGTDTTVNWVLGLTIGCVALVAGLLAWRLAYGWPAHAIARLAGALAMVLTLVAGAAWLAAGPLQPGWSRRAGTPPSLTKGSAPLNSAPQGSAPQGTTPLSRTPQGSAALSRTSQGSTSQGSAALSSASQGSAPLSSAPLSSTGRDR